MKLTFPHIKEGALFLMRKAGYGFERKDGKTGEGAFGRRIRGSEYPKFHVYAKKDGDTLFINLHLDQKRPVYEGVSAHSGEYEGEIVEQEAERIKIVLARYFAE